MHLPPHATYHGYLCSGRSRKHEDDANGHWYVLRVDSHPGRATPVAIQSRSSCRKTLSSPGPEISRAMSSFHRAFAPRSMHGIDVCRPWAVLMSHAAPVLVGDWRDAVVALKDPEETKQAPAACTPIAIERAGPARKRCEMPEPEAEAAHVPVLAREGAPDTGVPHAGRPTLAG